MLNSWQAVGRVAKKDTRTTPTGMMFVKFTLAVPREKDKSGNVQTDFIPCTIVGNSGKFFANYIEVGALVSVSGAIQSSQYEKNGQQLTGYSCFVTSYNLLIPAGTKGTQQQAAPVQQQYQPQNYGGFVPSQGAPQAPAPMPPAPPVVDNLPPDPYDGTLPFDIGY